MDVDSEIIIAYYIDIIRVYVFFFYCSRQFYTRNKWKISEVVHEAFTTLYN